MAATLEEIIVGTSLEVEYFEQTQNTGNFPVTWFMFEDPVLADIFKTLEKAYKEGRYDRTWGLFDLLELFKDDFPKMLRVVDVSINGYFPSLKWEYNRECFYTGRGKWTDLKFPDYVKSFVKNYEERCKAKRNRTS